ncbi:MAG: metallophosphoesterase [Halobacteriota archaeon]
MIYLISDLHLDYKNIIKYCDRPFSSVEEMNRTIIDNWNEVVNEDDFVYLVGDLAFGRKRTKIRYGLKKMNGNIILLLGNHDKGYLKSVPHAEKCVLTYGGKKFLLIHDLGKVREWDGWIIHGHEHNNKPEKYPFMNGKNKTINVSVELINYSPISIDFLVDKIDNTIYWEAIDKEPAYKKRFSHSFC